MVQLTFADLSGPLGSSSFHQALAGKGDLADHSPSSPGSNRMVTEEAIKEAGRGWGKLAVFL